MNNESFSSEEVLINYSASVFDSEYSFLIEFLDDTETIELQTSGSTGTPKVIEVKKEFMVNSARATGEFFNLYENTSALLCMNPNFIGGKMMLVRAMLLGWHLDVVTPSSSPLSDKEKLYDFSAMVPMQVKGSFKDLHKVKKLIIGGGAVSISLGNSLQNLSAECYSTYGMTETVSHIAVKKLNNFKSFGGGTTKQSVYKTLPNVNISTDKRNCLIIDAPNISETRIKTNDVVEFISATEFKWLGRYDNIINSGGVKLNPEQIEEKLSKIITQRFFVTGIPDERLGERLVLIVESNNQSSVILSEVKNLPNLSKFEIPKEVYFVPKFVETKTKKIQRSKTLDLIYEL